MDAREYFDMVRDAQQSIDRLLSILASMRSREGARSQRYDSIGGAGKGGTPRSFADATNRRIDSEQHILDEIDRMIATVEDGRELCEGVRAANPTHQIWGAILQLRYCEDMPWSAIANQYDISERRAYSEHNDALAWIDRVGLAAAREGCGQTQLQL